MCPPHERHDVVYIGRYRDCQRNDTTDASGVGVHRARREIVPEDPAVLLSRPSIDMKTSRGAHRAEDAKLAVPAQALANE